jgi:hypothetical protein
VNILSFHRYADIGKLFFLAMFAALVAVNGSARAEMVGYWTGNGTAADSVNGNDGTLVNGTTYDTGRVGQAFSLNGSDGYVDLPDATSNLVLNSAGTIAAWVNPSVVGGNDIVAAFGSGNGGQGIGLGIFGGAGGVRIYHHYGEYDWQTNTAVAADTWTHLAYTWDATTETVYLNGAFNVSRPRGTFSYVPGHARIGHGFWGDGANLFPGLIDEVRVYNTALTPGEVAALVPEPSSLMLLGFGTLAFTSWIGLKRKRRLGN